MSIARRFEKPGTLEMPVTTTVNFVEPISAADTLALTARCPDCHAGALIFEQTRVCCRYCRAEFPVVKGRAVLLRHDNHVFPLQSFSGHLQSGRGKAFSRLVPSPSVNLSFERSLHAFRKTLSKFQKTYVLVVGSGKQRKKLERFFPASEGITLMCCDVDVNADIDVFCDAHELPFRDGVFQGVITTAVLQHVLHPERVVGEMFRVLSSGGVIYSEVAFMQQVCEGAYDYTRYSLSGHRVLLKDFRELSAGLVAGPGTALVWAVENFVLSFMSGPRIRLVSKAVVRLFLFWIKYFDYFLRDKPAAIDGASCTYFLGTKNADGGTSDQEIVNNYVGEKHLRHL